MKQHTPARLPVGSVAAAVLALTMTVSLLTACFEDSSAVSDASNGETAAETVPADTLPDLTDDREPTSTADYTTRLELAFSTTETAPAEQFTYTVSENGVTVTGYTGGELVVVIPDTIEDKPVVAIAEKAFAGMGNLMAVSVPDTVVAIGIGAFEDCKSLSTLRTPVFTCHTAPYFGALFGATSYEINAAEVPDSLTTLIITAGDNVPDFAFYDCDGLEVVSLPATVTEIGNFAFYGCESLAHIPLSHTALTAIGERAFTNCAALLSLEVPATVNTMGAAMLEGCGALETLTLPFMGGYSADYELTDEEEKAIEEGEMTAPTDTAYLGYLFGAASYNFTAGYLPASLIRVTLLEGCGDLPANAFFECASIREVVLPEGLASIGHRAFYGCERLSAVNLPDSVTTVGDDAFHGCTRLVEVHLGTGLTTLGVQTFMDCVSLVEVTLPDGVTHLPNSCFAGCVSLETLTADGVKTVGKQVFRHCYSLQGWVEASTTETQ